MPCAGRMSVRSRPGNDCVGRDGVPAMPHVQENSTISIREDDNQPFAADDIDVRATPGLTRRVNVKAIADDLRRAAGVFSSRERITIARISVLIVDDARMIDFHARHSSDPTTTDVLTFDLRDDASLPIDADIVVCADEAARRAVEFGHSIERELLLYCVHGLLHCAGFDDHADGDWRRMHAREDELLEAIGVGATFSPPPSAGGGRGVGESPSPTAADLHFNADRAAEDQS